MITQNRSLCFVRISLFQKRVDLVCHLTHHPVIMSCSNFAFFQKRVDLVCLSIHPGHYGSFGFCFFRRVDYVCFSTSNRSLFFCFANSRLTTLFRYTNLSKNGQRACPSWVTCLPRLGNVLAPLGHEWCLQACPKHSRNETPSWGMQTAPSVQNKGG